MSEQLPSDEQSSAQFDAEAAQKAKSFLEQGVRRNKDGEVIARPVDRNVVGWPQTLEKTAKDLRRDVKQFDEGPSHLDAQEEHWREKGVEQEVAGDIFGARKSYDLAQGVRLLKPDAIARRDKAVQTAEDHYQSNQSGYVAQAITDANKAGHDINLGGHSFPAQPQSDRPNSSHK